jgi:hypothetical protein
MQHSRPNLRPLSRTLLARRPWISISAAAFRPTFSRRQVSGCSQQFIALPVPIWSLPYRSPEHSSCYGMSRLSRISVRKGCRERQHDKWDLYQLHLFQPSKINFSAFEVHWRCNDRLPIPVAARYKAWVCGRSLAGIGVSNTAGNTDVYPLWVWCEIW